MTRRVRLYLVGTAALVALAGCGRGLMPFQEREAWRHQAEVDCLKSNGVKIGSSVVQISPIEGPGMCGADFPLKVGALGDSAPMGYADDLRPPGSIPNASPAGPRWPISEPRPYTQAPSVEMPPPDARYAPPSYPQPTYQQPTYPQQSYPQQTYAPPQSRMAPPAGAPLSINPPGIAPPDDDDIPDDAELPASRAPQTRPAYNTPNYPQPPRQPLPALGPTKRYAGPVGPAVVTPAATLACPIVSALEQWVSGAVQPAALKWFGQPVVEIKQISAYSCRGMNGNPNAHISEHAFGNALDVAAFVLADGHRVTVKNGWQGTPEEQAFLHDVQYAACQTFTTVLAPGSNRYHYDHIHVDLMRRARRPRICEPGPIDGEVVAARAQNRLAHLRDPASTGSIGRAETKKAAEPGADDIWDDEDQAEEATKDIVDVEPHRSVKPAPARTHDVNVRPDAW
ncbi:MAG TPA: extensin family protein [Pseudolabrys sp.]|nr:extensin family protein [Pseudolabrys sp.]